MNLTLLLLLLIQYLLVLSSCHAFAPNPILHRKFVKTMEFRSNGKEDHESPIENNTNVNADSNSHLSKSGMDENIDEETLLLLNEQRLKVWKQRRENIRGTLKFADTIRNFRIENNIGVEEDSDADDAKFALSITAFVVAVGAVVLRVGGRAALVSGLGLDFMSSDPELTTQLNSFLAWCDNLGPVLEPAIFIAAWMAVKVFCFDAGGVVLALASGVLFGGVIQGALMSALGATVGSAAAFGLAKVDSPVRKKALELLDENPSLRGLEKVVAKDGIKAILTLRLAPVLPIPIGAYNYVYGVTNVPFTDFVGGIFIGSLKPYLLDSYLGYFGKSVVDGTVGTSTDTSNDVILLGALGVAVLIGVFASQLASKTFESITAEIEADKRDKGVVEVDKPMTEILGMELPQAVVGLQLALKMAEKRLQDTVVSEYKAEIWNMTEVDNLSQNIDPAYSNDSPEVCDPIGFDVGLAVAEGIMLTPVLWGVLTKYSDPKFNPNEEEKLPNMQAKSTDIQISFDASDVNESQSMTYATDIKDRDTPKQPSDSDVVVDLGIDDTSSENADNSETAMTSEDMIEKLAVMKEKVEKMLSEVKKDIGNVQ